MAICDCGAKSAKRGGASALGGTTFCNAFSPEPCYDTAGKEEDVLSLFSGSKTFSGSFLTFTAPTSSKTWV